MPACVDSDTDGERGGNDDGNDERESHAAHVDWVLAGDGCVPPSPVKSKAIQDEGCDREDVQDVQELALDEVEHVRGDAPKRERQNDELDGVDEHVDANEDDFAVTWNESRERRARGGQSKSARALGR